MGTGIQKLYRKNAISGKFVSLFKSQPGYVSDSSGISSVFSEVDSKKLSVGDSSKDRTLTFSQVMVLLKLKDILGNFSNRLTDFIDICVHFNCSFD